MKPAPLLDLDTWNKKIIARQKARHGEREKTSRELFEFAHDQLRRDVAEKGATA